MELCEFLTGEWMNRCGGAGVEEGCRWLDLGVRAEGRAEGDCGGFCLRCVSTRAAYRLSDDGMKQTE